MPLFVVVPDAFEEHAFKIVSGGIEFADQSACVHQQHAIRDTSHLIEMMAADQNRRACLRPSDQLFAQQDH